MTKPAIGAVDLFCGAGGLTKGLIEAGVDVRLGIDLDPACRHAYEQNNTSAEFLLANIASLKPTAITSAWAGMSTRILAGCAPCQPFSTYTQGKRWDKNDRWGLLRAFSRLIRTCEPDIVTMENVPSLAQQDVFDQFCKTLERSDYQVVWDVLDCRAFGIPQSRKRLVLIASRLGSPFLPQETHPAPEDWLTVRSAIAKLPALNAGEADENDPIHVSSRLTTVNLKRIRASKPGGTWRDWPSELVATCHTRHTGRTYPAVYGRMAWDAPSPTITGQCFGFGNGRFGHPEQDRAISLREAAILQTFPRSYAFLPPGERVLISAIGQMIGNAVPPRLGNVIGKAIRRHIQDAQS